jgi:excisionase family DNA binding protein
MDFTDIYSKNKETVPPEESERRFKAFIAEARKGKTAENAIDYESIIRKAQKIPNRSKRLKFFDLAVQELRYKLAEGRKTYRSLMNRGELAFPEDALEYLDTLMLTLKKLKLYLKRQALSEEEAKSLAAPKADIARAESKQSEEPKDDKTESESKPRDYLKTKEVAELLRLPISSIYKMTRLGRIPCASPPGSSRLIFKRSKIDEWIKKNERKTLR